MQNIYRLCFFSLLLFIHTTSSAEVYKWTDENGQVHYGQQPPQGKQAQQIKAPPPPTIDPRDAEKKIEQLILEQENLDRARAYEKELTKQQTIQQQNNEKQCETAKSNLQSYQNNPNRKSRLPDGTIQRLSEEERQQTIESLKAQVNVYCN